MNQGYRHAPSGNYRYIPAIRAYSGGVAADREYQIANVRFADPVPLRSASALILRVAKELGRPLTALCGLELRSTTPMTYSQFAAFNRRYVHILQKLDILDPRRTPIARTNVVPIYDPPREPVVAAMSFTMPSRRRLEEPSFVIAGSAESSRLSAETVVRRGETTADAISAKVDFVLAEIARRLHALGVSLRPSSRVNVYTALALPQSMVSRLQSACWPCEGITLYPARPPVDEVAFEMDIRSVGTEYDW